MAAREKRAAKEMSSASKQVTENVKRNAELNKHEAEVGLCDHGGDCNIKISLHFVHADDETCIDQGCALTV